MNNNLKLNLLIMKKTSLLSKALLGTAVLAMGLGIQSCKNEPKPEDTKEVAEDENEAKFDDTANDSLEDDSEYLVAAAEVDMKEIDLSKLAQTKSTNADVKAFAQMMIDQHTKAAAELKTLAATKNISLPEASTEKTQDAVKDLNDKTGKDFDKKYADMMVDGHEKTIDKIEKASEKAKDPDIKIWATKMVPTLRTHLEHAKILKEKVDAVK
jgi:putative membrane protein